MADLKHPLNEEELAELDELLSALPAPLEPLDLSMLDGYLVGVLLQPKPIAEAQWLPGVWDCEGRALPQRVDTRRLQALIARRHAELNRAIHHRQWFDPWVFEHEDEDEDDLDPLEAVLPWVAGFAWAMDSFPALMDLDSAETVEPLAVLYRSFDPDDLEDADELLAAIEELEPPQDLAEAVEALVNSSLLLADVTRPQPVQPVKRAEPRPTRSSHANPGPGPRSPAGRPGPRRPR